MTARSSSISRQIPIIDLGKEYRELRSEIDPALERILASGSYILGQEGTRFEQEIAAYCGTAHGIGVNSGTDALQLAYRALDLKEDDEVIMPSMSFIATAEPAALMGARPIFVDVDPETYTLDSKEAERAITNKTKAIVAVHLYGQAADMKGLGDVAKAAKVPLLEDMAQAIGAEFEGKKVGSFGSIACLSFFPTKNLGACGDAGAVLTNSEALAVRMRRLRNHGQTVKYQHEEVGYNTRLDELQAAILRIKLRHLDAWNERRRQLAALYSQGLKGLPIRLPIEASGRKHIYHLFSIMTERRDELQKYLQSHGIASGLHYPTPLHLQPAFRSLGGKSGDHPNSERLARETLSLPLYPHMTDDDVQYVLSAVHSFYGKP
jgi:dTDP-4-amino-4,6-dideoxygalactose transaminase